jgi:para-nitrobenzyl esterase
LKLGRVAACIILASCLVASGCKQGGLKTFVYACADSVEARVTNLDPEASKVRLEVGSRRWTLERDTTASGAKYSDGDVTFWSKGKLATIEEGGRPMCRDCRLVRTLEADAVAAGGSPAADLPASIVGVEWEWIALTTPQEKLVIDDPERYTLTLLPEGRVAARLDCNRGTGKYTLDEPARRIDIGLLATTRAQCPETSRADRFAKLLDDASVAWLAEDGSFVLELPAGSGTLRFRARPGPR